ATSDGRSFALSWFPATTGVNGRTMIVTLHGSSSWAFDEFYLWYDVAQRHGHGIIALQWWLANDVAPNDYYGPNEVYQELAPAILDAGIAPGRALLHGFSRGSANLYYVRMFDLRAKNNFFALTLANAGGASVDYPFYQQVVAGQYGAKPFLGARFATYCGGLDPNPDRDGCPAMRRTADFIKLYGGTVDLAIEESAAGHGGFHQSAAQMDSVVTAFDALLSTANTAWTVKPDGNFLISSASIPNVGLVKGEVWLTVGGPGGTRLFRSTTGDNSAISQSINGLGTALSGTGYAPSETVPRETATGERAIYVLGLAPPGSSGAALFRLVENGSGQFTRDPGNLVFTGTKQFLGVPDLYPTSDGRLRLIYVDLGATRTNSRTAISSDGGRSFVAEYDNPFNDLNVSMPGASNTNVDPAVVKLAGGGYLAVAMRLKKLYLFTSADGKIFLPLNGGAAIEAPNFRTGATGFFDPTLVQLADGRIFMYVTLEQSGQPEAVGRAELIPTRGVGTTSAASYLDRAVAAESISATFGVGLAGGTVVASSLPLPQTLGGTSVLVRDSAGIERAAPLFFVAPGQVNFQVPAGTATGEARLTVTNSNANSEGRILIQTTAPGVFTANTDGAGAPAGTALRYRNGILVASQPLFVSDSSTGRYIPLTVGLGEAGDESYLVLYGTGWRNRGSLAEVTAQIGGIAAQVVYAGAQGDFAGLDQLNIRVPRELIGRGTVDLVVTVGARKANTVQVRF
ncbi:MAG: hypothetical protein ACKOB4_07360, partial [Acidobacteriota bacterium]